MESGTTHPGVRFGFGFAFVFLFVRGLRPGVASDGRSLGDCCVGPTFSTRWDGRIYFPGVGALLLFTLGCTAAAISPKPFWIADQTFLEAAVITAQREGLCLLFCGFALGACYSWLERRIRAVV